jgi:glycosyltransferase involved in cell wall biosynthesis
MQKHIAILLPDLNGGGAERLHIKLANYWYGRGFSVDFVLMNSRGDLIELVADGLGIIDLGAARIRHVVIPLVKYLRKVRPDILLVAMWPLTSIAALSWLIAGRPSRLYLSDHAHLSISCLAETNTHPWLLANSIRWTYSFAHGIIAVSEGVKQDLCRLGGFAPSKVCVIYNPAANGASSERLPSRDSKELWGEGFNFHILSVGTLKAQKDHATLIRAFAMLPKFLIAKLIILGEGKLREELEELIRELRLQNEVELPGFVIDPSPWFRSADLFVLSSGYEGFGNVIVEALEHGVPVVSTDCLSGPAEILEYGKYGKLVPVHDHVSLAAAMNASHCEEHDRMLLIDRAMYFSIDRISAQYLSYFWRE